MNFKFNLISRLSLSVLFLFSSILSGDPVKERIEIISVVNNFFKIIETKDVDLAKKTVLQGSCFFSIQESKGEKNLRSTSYNDFIKNLASGKNGYKEEMFDPKVLIHKNIALVWARYKFYRNGKYSHCGVDSFSLIKVGGKWKIASIVYTIEKEGCN